MPRLNRLDCTPVQSLVTRPPPPYIFWSPSSSILHLLTWYTQRLSARSFQRPQ